MSPNADCAAGMQVNFGLLEDDRRAFWGVEAEHEDGEDLGDAEADIGDQCFGAGLRLLHFDLVQRIVADLLNAELVQQPDFAEHL